MLNTLLVHDRQWISIRGFTFVSPHFILPSNWQDMPAIVVDDADVVIDSTESLGLPEKEAPGPAEMERERYMDIRVLPFPTPPNRPNTPMSIDIKKNSTDIFIQDQCQLTLLQLWNSGPRTR